MKTKLSGYLTYYKQQKLSSSKGWRGCLIVGVRSLIIPERIRVERLLLHIKKSQLSHLIQSKMPYTGGVSSMSTSVGTLYCITVEISSMAFSWSYSALCLQEAEAGAV